MLGGHDHAVLALDRRRRGGEGGHPWREGEDKGETDGDQGPASRAHGGAPGRWVRLEDPLERVSRPPKGERHELMFPLTGRFATGEGAIERPNGYADLGSDDAAAAAGDRRTFGRHLAAIAGGAIGRDRIDRAALASAAPWPGSARHRCGRRSSASASPSARRWRPGSRQAPCGRPAAPGA